MKANERREREKVVKKGEKCEEESKESAAYLLA